MHLHQFSLYSLWIILTIHVNKLQYYKLYFQYQTYHSKLEQNIEILFVIRLYVSKLKHGHLREHTCRYTARQREFANTFQLCQNMLQMRIICICDHSCTQRYHNKFLTHPSPSVPFQQRFSKKCSCIVDLF